MLFFAVAAAVSGRLAGLEVVKLIREPVAAALAYGLNLEEEQVVLVFDLGGGTYDISLLEVGGGTVEVLSTGGEGGWGGPGGGGGRGGKGSGAGRVWV